MKQVIRILNGKPIKTTNSGKVRLVNQKLVQEKLMKKDCGSMRFS